MTESFNLIIRSALKPKQFTEEYLLRLNIILVVKDITHNLIMKIIAQLPRSIQNLFSKSAYFLSWIDGGAILVVKLFSFLYASRLDS